MLSRPDGTELDIAPGRVRAANGPDVLVELRSVLGD